MPFVTTAQGIEFQTGPRAARDADVNRQYDRDQGQPGVISPSNTAWMTNVAAVMAANRGFINRFVPTRNMTITNLGFLVTVAASVDDPVDVGLYNSALTTKLGSSGATAGKLNSLGTKTVPLTASVSLVAGTVYYAALSQGTLGGTAASLCGTGPASLLYVPLFGATAGLVDLDVKATMHPLPSAWGAMGGVSATTPVLTIRES